jgi:hypothetical protein
MGAIICRYRYCAKQGITFASTFALSLSKTYDLHQLSESFLDSVIPAMKKSMQHLNASLPQLMGKQSAEACFFS